jgi:ComF family protein
MDSSGGFRGSMNQRLLSQAIGHLFPSRCPSCGAETDNISHAPFCGRCWAGIKRYSGPACRICSTPFASQFSHICSGCLKNPPPFSRALAYGIYDGVLADAIHHLKFRGIRRLHRPLGRFLLTLDLSGIDALVPVPLSAAKLRERGFNQSLLLAKVVSGKAGIPLILNGLLKKKDVLPQIGLSAAGRTANIRGAFSAERSFGGMRLMLIDDVMTTGATARECTKELLMAGAADVTVAALARASAV